MVQTNHAVCAVQCVSPQALDCLDSGFESRRKHRCFVFVVSSVGSGFFDDLITLAEESYRMFVCISLYVI